MNDTIQKTDVTTSELILGLSKEGLAYQDLLQQAENVIFTKDNLNEERTALVSLRKVKSKLDAMQNPWTEKWKAWNESRKSLVDPVAAVLQKKEGEFRKLANEIAAENKRIADEKAEDARILLEIDTFFLTQSQVIANAKTADELVRVEKLIGSHKNASRYGKHLPLMAEKAQNLTELIRTAKDAIKKIADLRAKEQAAEAKGDDQAVLNLREQQETVTAKLEEAKIHVQEASISMATQADVVEPEVILAKEAKPRIKLWRFEVVNDVDKNGNEIENSGLKKAEKAGLTLLILDLEKVGEILKEKRKTENECTENGIRYYIEKSY